MKIKLNFSILLLLFSSHFKLNAQVLSVSGNLGGDSNVDLHINAGNHSDGLNFPNNLTLINPTLPTSLTWARSIRFIAEFRTGCNYVFTGTATTNQVDWNKLWSLNVSPYSDLTSVRLGWRWNPVKNKVELGLYGHIMHVDKQPYLTLFPAHQGREFLYVTEVNQNQGIECELILGAEGMGVIAGYVGSFIKRRGIFPAISPTSQAPNVTTVSRKSAFFGGDESAPAYTVIRVININADGHTNWHSGACEKTFSRSEFYMGENLTILAGTSITMSEQVFRGQYKVNGSNFPLYNALPPNNTHSLVPNVSPPVADRDEVPWFEQDGERFVKIEAGANIITRAGSEIILLPGFEAVTNSNFEASIAPISCATWAGRSNAINSENDVNETEIGSENLTTNAEFPQTNNTKGGESNSIMNVTNGFFGVFPNPNNGVFTVKREKEVKGAYIEICNNLGVRLQKHVLKSLDEKVNMSSLANGIYTVYLYENNMPVNFVKLVKQ